MIVAVEGIKKAHLYSDPNPIKIVPPALGNILLLGRRRRRRLHWLAGPVGVAAAHLQVAFALGVRRKQFESTPDINKSCDARGISIGSNVINSC